MHPHRIPATEARNISPQAGGNNRPHINGADGARIGRRTIPFERSPETISCAMQIRAHALGKAAGKPAEGLDKTVKGWNSIRPGRHSHDEGREKRGSLGCT